MFTDMVGYTELMQRDEPLAVKKRNRHREVFQQLHKKYSGHIIQYFGDGTLSIFTSSVYAVACAIEMQQLLKAPIEVPLRIGLHTGEILIEKDDIIGDAVNIASRIESFSIPGAVLISDALYEQIKNQPQFECRSLGNYQLKNVDRPFGIYALANEGLVIPTPAAMTGKGKQDVLPENNLPKALTSFLGREKEISELVELLQEHVLITLSGPGGSGKTRLAIEVAKAAATHFPDGIFWVSLVSVTDTNEVVFAIANQLGLKEEALQSIEEVLLQFFRDKRSLLILDNFEQIVGASPLVERLVQVTQPLRILVSSRVLLQIAGEVEYPVLPLPTPKLNGNNQVAQLERIESVALFAERAKEARRTFQLNQDNIETVAQICLRLDGLPLAIELAAARAKIFKPAALLKRLSKNLDVLKGDGRFPARHQTLRQTIAWSYDLLETKEQELFQRSAVFMGGGTLEAIEDICGRNGLSDWDIVDGVMALVDKSLLQSQETEVEMRFYMLETIREFAVEALESSQQGSQLKKAHIDYYLQLAETAAPLLSGPQAEEWNTILLQEQANLKAAIEYAVQLGQMEKAYRIGLALRPFWGSKGMTMEGIQQLEKITSLPVPDDLYSQRLKVLEALGMMYFYIPDIEKAVAIFEESLTYWRQQEDKRRIGMALNNLGWLVIMWDEHRRGVAYSLEAKEIFSDLGDQALLTASINNLGWSYMFRTMPLDAIPYFEQTLQLTKHLGDRRRHAYARTSMGFCHYMKGDYQLAEAELQRSLAIFREGNDGVLEGYALMVLGFLAYAKGDFKACEQISREAEAIGRKVNAVFVIANSYEHRASAALGRGDLAGAKHWAEQALSLFFGISTKLAHWPARSVATLCKTYIRLGELQPAGDWGSRLLANVTEGQMYHNLIPGLEIAAWIAGQRGEYVPAAQLFYHAQALREQLHTPFLQSEKHFYKEFAQRLGESLDAKQLVHSKDQQLTEQALVERALQVFQF